jgi:acyl-coenzyme A synthetase/AMP-(fatty) acid ligase
MPSDSATPHPRLHQGVFQPHLLVHALSHDLDRPVLYTDDDHVLTARDLRECASRYYQALASYGLEPGTRIGSQGRLRIVDRKKDMIISGGFNIYPREIEDILCAHPAVAQCAVIGVRDPHWGEAVKAVVVLWPAAQHCAAELIALVREKKGAVQAPKSVDFVESIQLTAVGKPDKKVLRAGYTTAD